MSLRVMSWNVSYDHPAPNKICELLHFAPAALICLQEVSDELLELLTKSQHWHLASTPSGVGQNKSGPKKYHNVILSTYPIQTTKTIPLPLQPYNPLRVKWFIKVIRVFRPNWLTFTERSAIYAEVELPVGVLRVVNAHLALSYPAHRKKELEIVLNECNNEVPCVICGDFNIVESWRLTLLNWFLGGTLLDILLKRRERKTFERIIYKHGLFNHLRGRSTHTFGASQLDHILVPTDAWVSRAHVNSCSYGSDHFPIQVTVET